MMSEITAKRRSRFDLITRWCAAAALFVFGLQIFSQSPVYPHLRVHFGYDYRQVFDATVLWIRGHEPYSVSRYVFPPTFLAVNAPLVLATWTAWTRAALVVSAASTFGLVLLLVWLGRAYGVRVRFAHLAALLFGSYPFLFMFDRANIDGLVAALTWTGVALSLKSSSREETAGGVLWGLAVTFKVYPALLGLPMLLRRRWRFLAGGLAVVAMSVAAQPDLYRTYMSSRFLQRASATTRSASAPSGLPVWGGTEAFVWAENGSFAVAADWMAWIVGGGQSFRRAQAAGTVILILLLAVNTWLDLRRSNSPDVREELFQFSPFPLLMVSIPATVYLYEYVAVLPVALILADQLSRHSETRALAWVAAGAFVLTQCFSFAYASLLPEGTTLRQSAYALNSIGLLILAVSLTGLRFPLARRPAPRWAHPI